MKKIRVLLSGFYGFGNTGDEAMLSVVLKKLREQFNGLEITVISNDPKSTSKAHDVISISWLIPLQELISYVDAIDIVIVGGGQLFDDCGDYHGDELLKDTTYFNVYILNLILLSFLRNKKCIALGIGVTPSLDQQFKHDLGIIMNTCKHIYARDEFSKEMLLSVGCASNRIHICNDLGLYLENCSEQRINDITMSENIDASKPIIGVTLLNHQKEPAWVAELIEIFNNILINTNYNIIMIPFYKTCEKNDRIFMKKIVDNIIYKERVTLLNGDYHPNEIAGIISKCKIVIGMRYHSLIFALKNSIPCISIVYSDASYNIKVPYIMKYYGLHNYTCFVDKLQEKDFLSLIKNINNQYNYLSNQIDIINSRNPDILSKILHNILRSTSMKQRLNPFRIYLTLKKLYLLDKLNLASLNSTLLRIFKVTLKGLNL